MSSIDGIFAGSIPRLYDEHLVPLIFEPYAADLAERLRKLAPGNVLEVAAGTGVLTRAMDAALPAAMAIIATDLNPGMLEHARARGSRREVEWRQADALALPFGDAQFDAVVCQFGAMFFPDKAKAFAEARRVLRPGGAFLFNVWDRIEDNEFADVVTSELATMFPADPPRFLARTPHGYHDEEAIGRDLARGGFDGAPAVERISARSRASSARIPAVAYCQGTPLRNEIEGRGPDSLAEATERATRAIARRFGEGPIDGLIRAKVVVVRR